VAFISKLTFFHRLYSLLKGIKKQGWVFLSFLVFTLFEILIGGDSRVGKRISAQASHRTVRESLPSYGSCYPIMLLFQPSNDKTTTGVRPVQICISYTNLTYHVSYRYSSSTCG